MVNNVPEDEKVIQNIVVLHNAKMVESQHLPHPLNNIAVSQKATSPAAEPPTPQVFASSEVKIQPLAVTEREAIESAIAYCNGNIPKAAELLDVSPSTIYRKKVSWDSAG